MRDSNSEQKCFFLRFILLVGKPPSKPAGQFTQRRATTCWRPLQAKTGPYDARAFTSGTRTCGDQQQRRPACRIRSFESPQHAAFSSVLLPRLPSSGGRILQQKADKHRPIRFLSVLPRLAVHVGSEMSGHPLFALIDDELVRAVEDAEYDFDAAASRMQHFFRHVVMFQIPRWRSSDLHVDVLDHFSASVCRVRYAALVRRRRELRPAVDAVSSAKIQPASPAAATGHFLGDGTVSQFNVFSDNLRDRFQEIYRTVVTSNLPSTVGDSGGGAEQHGSHRHRHAGSQRQLPAMEEEDDAESDEDGDDVEIFFSASSRGAPTEAVLPMLSSTVAEWQSSSRLSASGADRNETGHGSPTAGMADEDDCTAPDAVSDPDLQLLEDAFFAQVGLRGAGIRPATGSNGAAPTASAAVYRASETGNAQATSRSTHLATRRDPASAVPPVRVPLEADSDSRQTHRESWDVPEPLRRFVPGNLHDTRFMDLRPSR